MSTPRNEPVGTAGGRRVLVLGLVGAVAVGVYANSLSNGFAYDDNLIVQERIVTHGLDSFEEILGNPYWIDNSDAGLYRPLTLLMFAGEWKLWDGEPWGFHLVNILLHASVSVLLVLLLARYFPLWASGIGGLVFAVHPVHTEAVANVVGRSELLAALFIVLACFIYTGETRRGQIRPGAGALIAACYLLAGLSKEGGFVLPGLLLATDVPLLAAKPKFRDFFQQRLPLFVALLVIFVSLMAARSAVLGNPFQDLTNVSFALDSGLGSRLFTMARVWPRYVELMVFPLDLSADYSPSVILPASRLTGLGGLGFLLALSGLALAAISFRKIPGFAMALAWFGIAVLPVSNLLFLTEVVLAERTLYVPSMAVAMIVALAVPGELLRGRRRWLLAGLAVWIVFFAGVTVARNPVWRSTDSVFESLRREHPESSRLLWEIGLRHKKKGDWREARTWFERSLQAWPYHPRRQAELSELLMGLGELGDAEARSRIALGLRPEDKDLYMLLASILLARGKPGAAHAVVDSAFMTFDADPELAVLKARAHLLDGQLRPALTYLEAAVRQAPESARPWLLLAQVQAAMGDTAEALLALEHSRRLSQGQQAKFDSIQRSWNDGTR